MALITLETDIFLRLIGGSQHETPQHETQGDAASPWIGEYVIVRCSAAGVHAGRLVEHDGRSCVLADARRLWRWVPANGAKWLNGVANHGLHADSKISEPVLQIILTENCEIIATRPDAEKSIREMKASANE